MSGMLQLIKHELYKLYNNKSIRISFLLCMIIFALFAYNSAPLNSNNYHNVYKNYKVGEGKITNIDLLKADQGINQLKKIYDNGIRFNDKELGQWLLYWDITNAVKQSARYQKSIIQLKQQNSKTARLQYDILRKVGPLEDVFYTEGWSRIIKFWGSIGYYLAIILVIFGLSSIFPDEYATGMSSLIGSSREGKRKLVYAKIYAAGIYVLTIVASLEVLNMITNVIFYSIAGYAAPLKNVLYTTPFQLSIIQFWVFKLFIEILAVLVIGAFTMLLSILTRNSVISMGMIASVIMVYDFILRNGASMLLGDFLRLTEFGGNYSRVYERAGFSLTYEQLLVGMLVVALLTGISLLNLTCKRQREV